MKKANREIKKLENNEKKYLKECEARSALLKTDLENKQYELEIASEKLPVLQNSQSESIGELKARLT